jgi:hypothetical protein
MKISKFLLLIFLLINTLVVLGQSNFDFDQITNNWTEGKIDSNGKVVQADINRGGWSSLDIKADQTVIFSGPYLCGSGSARKGKWVLIMNDSTIKFIFNESVPYVSTHGTQEINETEIYKIEKVSKNELILNNLGGNKATPFILTDRIDK